MVEPETSSPAGTGCGRRERRREAIVAAAAELFLERGFEAVSLAEIVRYSGGSLSTLYELFENKQGLLAAVMENERYDGFQKVSEIIARADGPADTLEAIGRVVFDSLTAGRKIALMRIAMAESLRNPALARKLYDAAHRPMLALVEASFARWADEGHLDVEDPELAARQFLSLVLHPVLFPALFCESLSDSDRVDQPRITQGAVHLIMSAYTPRAAGAIA